MMGIVQELFHFYTFNYSRLYAIRYTLYAIRYTLESVPRLAMHRQVQSFRFFGFADAQRHFKER